MGKKLFVLVALLLMTLPLLLAPFGVDMRAYRTDAQVASFADDPLGYLVERMPLRTAAITGRARLISLVAESGSPQVLRGREGFLFFAESIQEPPLTPAERASLAEKLLALEGALAADGRRLIVLIAPDKRSVYPELLPANILPEETDGLALLNAELSAAGLTVLDAQSLLTARKAEGLLYFAGDSHWNARGAGIVYRALMDLTGTDAPDYANAPLLPGTAGDLLLLCQPGTPPTEADAEPDISRIYRTTRPMRTVDDARIQTTSPSTELSMLVIRDSFGRALFPYLANACGRLTFSRSDKDVAGQAASARAEWVVVEVVQRNVRDWLIPGALIPEE